MLTDLPVICVNIGNRQSISSYLLVLAALLFAAATFKLFLTLFTPSTAFATCSAFAFCAAEATVPVRVTTPLSTSTLIVESRRSSAAASSNFVFTQSQPSFKPVPTVGPLPLPRADSDLCRAHSLHASELCDCVSVGVCCGGVGVGICISSNVRVGRVRIRVCRLVTTRQSQSDDARPL